MKVIGDSDLIVISDSEAKVITIGGSEAGKRCQ